MQESMHPNCSVTNHLQQNIAGTHVIGNGGQTGELLHFEVSHEEAILAHHT